LHGFLTTLGFNPHRTRPHRSWDRSRVMGEPTTPAEARRQGLNRARWVVTGAAVGTAALLGGVIAAVNGAPASSSNSNSVVRTEDGTGHHEHARPPATPPH